MKKNPTKSGAKGGRASLDAEKQLQSFIAKFEPKNQALICTARKALRKRFPTANELAYDNYNFFALGYCSTERPADCVVSIAAAANGVGLSFYWGATLPDPHGILLGSGNQNRFIRLESVKVLARPEVLELIAAMVLVIDGTEIVHSYPVIFCPGTSSRRPCSEPKMRGPDSSPVLIM